MIGYRTRFIPQELEGPVCEYWRMSKAFAEDPSSRLSRLSWTTTAIIERYPEETSETSWNGVYKDVSCLCETGLEPWHLGGEQ